MEEWSSTTAVGYGDIFTLWVLCCDLGMLQNKQRKKNEGCGYGCGCESSICNYNSNCTRGQLAQGGIHSS